MLLRELSTVKDLVKNLDNRKKNKYWIFKETLTYSRINAD